MSYLTLVDLSEWNGTTGGHPLIDFPTLAQNVDGFIIKASGGDGKTTPLYRDANFTYNQTEARKTGLPIFYYHFAGGGDPVAECDYFLEQVGDLQEGEGIADDFEINHSNPGAWCGQFYNRAHDKINIWALQYSPRWLMQLIYPSVPNAGLWVADPDDSPDGTVTYNGSSVPYTYVMQQFTTTGAKPGVEGNVDLNAFFYTGDKENGIKELRAYGKTTPPAQTPTQTTEPTPSVVSIPVNTNPVPPTQESTPPAESNQETTSSTTSPTSGTVMDIKPTSTPVNPPKKVNQVVPQNQSEVTVVENDIRRFYVSDYGKFLTAVLGLFVTFLSQHYGASPIVKDAVMILTALGVYAVPNTKG